MHRGEGLPSRKTTPGRLRDRCRYATDVAAPPPPLTKGEYGKDSRTWLRNLITPLSGHGFPRAWFSPKISPSGRLYFKERH